MDWGENLPLDAGLHSSWQSLLNGNVVLELDYFIKVVHYTKVRGGRVSGLGALKGLFCISANSYASFSIIN